MGKAVPCLDKDTPLQHCMMQGGDIPFEGDDEVIGKLEHRSVERPVDPDFRSCTLDGDPISLSAPWQYACTRKSLVAVQAPLSRSRAQAAHDLHVLDHRLHLKVGVGLAEHIKLNDGDEAQLVASAHGWKLI